MVDWFRNAWQVSSVTCQDILRKRPAPDSQGKIIPGLRQILSPPQQTVGLKPHKGFLNIPVLSPPWLRNQAWADGQAKKGSSLTNGSVLKSVNRISERLKIAVPTRGIAEKPFASRYERMYSNPTDAGDPLNPDQRGRLCMEGIIWALPITSLMPNKTAE
jgi:hypothetical protein